MVENGEPDNKQMKSKCKVKCVLKQPGKKTKGLKIRKQGEKKEGVKQNERIESEEKSSKDKNKQ